MTTRNAVLIAATGGIALMGCTAFDWHRSAAPNVVPYQSVRHGGDAEMLYQAGRTFQARGRYADAILAYRQALVGNPSHVEAHNGLAVSYALAGKPDLAEREFRAALELAPGAAHLHNNLGFFLMSAGRVDEAIASLGRARELDPSSTVVSGNFASAEARVAVREVEAQAPPAAVAVAPPQEITPASAATALVQLPVVEARAEQPAPMVAPPVTIAAPPALSVVAPDAATSGASTVEAAPVPPAVEAKAADPAPAEAAPPVASLQGYGVEVSNGNGTRRLAWRTSRLFQTLGISNARLTNSKPFGVTASRMQYVPGAEAAAREMNAVLPIQIPLTPVASLERNAKVRVVLGRDFPATATRVADTGRKPGA